MEAELVNTIVCPKCSADLDATTDICSQCGAATSAGANSKELISRPWVIIALLLHVGLLGIPLYWKTNYSVTTRVMIVAASIIYTVVAVGFIVGMLRWLVGLF